MAQVKHRLVIKPHFARTACGIRILAFYPVVELALLPENEKRGNGSALLDCTVEGEDVTCPACRA